MHACTSVWMAARPAGWMDGCMGMFQCLYNTHTHIKFKYIYIYIFVYSRTVYWMHIACRLRPSCQRFEHRFSQLPQRTAKDDLHFAFHLSPSLPASPRWQRQTTNPKPVGLQISGSVLPTPVRSNSENLKSEACGARRCLLRRDQQMIPQPRVQDMRLLRV